MIPILECKKVCDSDSIPIQVRFDSHESTTIQRRLPISAKDYMFFLGYDFIVIGQKLSNKSMWLLLFLTNIQWNSFLIMVRTL